VTKRKNTCIGSSLPAPVTTTALFVPPQIRLDGKTLSIDITACPCYVSLVNSMSSLIVLSSSHMAGIAYELISKDSSTLTYCFLRRPQSIVGLNSHQGAFTHWDKSFGYL
jgi:hypothetical protein